MRMCIVLWQNTCVGRYRNVNSKVHVQFKLFHQIHGSQIVTVFHSLTNRVDRLLITNFLAYTLNCINCFVVFKNTYNECYAKRSCAHMVVDFLSSMSCASFKVRMSEMTNLILTVSHLTIRAMKWTSWTSAGLRQSTKKENSKVCLQKEVFSLYNIHVRVFCLVYLMYWVFFNSSCKEHFVCIYVPLLVSQPCLRILMNS